MALSQAPPCVSEKDVISVTPMYRWDLLYECAIMNVQKGLRFCLRLSFTLYCHGLPVPKEKKNIKAIQISYIKAMWVFIWFLWLDKRGSKAILIHVSLLKAYF